MATKDEKLIEEGKRALRRSYYESMESFAREIMTNAKAIGHTHFDDNDTQDWIGEQIHQTADSTSWVIYTHSALDVLVASDNWLAYEDHLGDVEGDLTKMVTHAAYWAVYEDIWEKVRQYEDEYFTDTEENPRRGRKKTSQRKRKNPESTLKNRLLR